MIHSLSRSLSRLTSHSGFKKYFFNTGWLMLDKVLRMFLGLFVGVWVARYLGPENFGILNFAMSFVGLFGAFGKLGLDGIIVRNIVRDPDERDEILGTSLVLRLCGAIVLMLAVFGALQLTSATTYEKIIVMIIAFGQLFMSFEVFDFYFQSQVKAKFSGITGTFGLLASSIARISFILIGLPLIWFAGAVIIEQLTKAIFFIYFYIKTASPIDKSTNNKYTNNKYTKPPITNTHSKLNIKNLKFSKATSLALLKDSWPLIFSGLAVAFYMKIDQIMVKELINNEAVGYYSVAVRLSEVWLFITMSITQSLFPATLNAKIISNDLYYERLTQFYKLLFIISFSISIVIYFFSEYIVILLFSSEYFKSIAILQIYVWSTIFVFLNNGSWHWYIAENLQHLAAIRLFVGAIANFILNYFLIKAYGLTGAATATVLSYAIASYFGNLIFKRTRINFKIQTLAILNVFNIRSYYK
ncbi:MAG: flippase [Flexistipes sinusarabici]|uniref:Flippase n=1 Tax=Flexistipes sinusarabici TaxID=2352 RepID=A0A5D0MPJ3_FLESI|nr:flippase [Flexistipes sinusarabici]TYB33440.1 MAG: flippase [Flexistipes sinusarabici]